MTHTAEEHDLFGDDGRTLHALRVAGWLAADRLTAWGIDEPGRTLDRLTEAELVRLVRSPRGEMYGLTPAGTERATALLTGWLTGDKGPDRGTLTDALAGFEKHDGTLKRLVTACQQGQRDGAGQRLGAFHQQAHDALAAVGAATALWASYPERLAAALHRVTDGDTDYLASPLVESYHTVWHLAHRDMRLVCEALPA